MPCVYTHSLGFFHGPIHGGEGLCTGALYTFIVSVNYNVNHCLCQKTFMTSAITKAFRLSNRSKTCLLSLSLRDFPRSDSTPNHFCLLILKFHQRGDEQIDSTPLVFNQTQGCFYLMSNQYFNPLNLMSRSIAFITLSIN
jgi:hypothetical protein